MYTHHRTEAKVSVSFSKGTIPSIDHGSVVRMERETGTDMRWGHRRGRFVMPSNILVFVIFFCCFSRIERNLSWWQQLCVVYPEFLSNWKTNSIDTHPSYILQAFLSLSLGSALDPKRSPSPKQHYSVRTPFIFSLLAPLNYFIPTCNASTQTTVLKSIHPWVSSQHEICLSISVLMCHSVDIYSCALRVWIGKHAHALCLQSCVRDYDDH